MAGVTAAVVGGVAAVGSAVSSSRAASKAASAQEHAADASVGEQRRQFDAAAEFQRPFREFGESFLDDLNSILTGETDLSEDPVLQFQLDDATRTINNRASHAGKFFQPRTTEALLQTRDSIIAGNRAQRVNELFSAVGLGQATATNQAAQAINTGRSIGDTLTQRGNAIAAGEVGRANAVNAGLTGIAGAFSDYAETQRQPQVAIDAPTTV